MVITYYGAACFKVQSGDTVLAFNPPSKDSNFKSPRFQTNIALVNMEYKDFNGVENLTGKAENSAPFCVNGPGEYEVGGICVRGIFSGLHPKYEAVNTIYTLNLEDINICHLGAYSQNELSADAKQEIGEIDVLFAPVENGSKKLIAQLEPKVVIPIYSGKEELKSFLKEAGNGDIKPIDKLTFKRKDLTDKKNEIVILESCL